MRVNVYAEEVTPEVKLVTKDHFNGLRIYLKSHDDLHHTPEDDDRSAITIWGLIAIRLLRDNINAAMDGLDRTDVAPHFPDNKRFTTTPSQPDIIIRCPTCDSLLNMAVGLTGTFDINT